jgi:hypothetical protein
MGVLLASSGSEHSSVIVATEISEIDHQVLAKSQLFSTRDQRANRISKKQYTSTHYNKYTSIVVNEWEESR